MSLESNHETYCPSIQPPSTHSYLPGTSQSLFIAPILPHHNPTIDHDSSTTSLPILQLPNVVLFPGNTIPLRLTHASWIHHVSTLMEAGQHVRIGIITQIQTRRQSHRQRSSWIRRASRLDTTMLAVMVMNALAETPPNTTDPIAIGRDTTDHTEKDPLIGRIGTVVTITHTNGTVLVNGQQQLLVTALGTGRYKILQVVDKDTRYHEDDMDSLRLYHVQELCDEPLKRPPIQRPFTSSKISNNNNAPNQHHHQHHHQHQRQDNIIASLSMMTATPSFCYKMIWPWKLVDQINHLMAHQTLSSQTTFIPPPNDDPTAVSFYLASNMALSERDKLHLLTLDGTVARLQYIHQKLLEQQKQQQHLACKLCFTKLSSVMNMFTVGGSEGTWGAYRFRRDMGCICQ